MARPKSVFKSITEVLQFCQLAYNYEGPKYADFSKKVGLHRSTIKRLVEGQTGSPHLRTVILFLDGLGYKLRAVNKTKTSHIQRKKRAMARVS